MKRLLQLLNNSPSVCTWEQIRRSAFSTFLREQGIILGEPRSNFGKYLGAEKNAPYGYFSCPCENGDLEPVQITKAPGGRFEFYITCRCTGERHVLSKEQSYLWRLDFERFLQFVGACFRCSLDKSREEQNGLWSLGRSDTSIYGVKRQFYFALKPTPAIQESFSKEKTAILLLGNNERKPDGEVGKRIFYLADVISMVNGKPAISNALLADSVRSQEVQDDSTPKHVSMQGSIHRLTDIVHGYLLDASEYYWGKNKDGSIRMALKKYKATQLLQDYQNKYPDDEFSVTVLRKMIDYKKGIHITPGAALQLRLMWSVWLKDVELVKTYKDSQINGRRIRDIDQHREENDEDEESWGFDYVSREEQEELCNLPGFRVRKGT